MIAVQPLVEIHEYCSCRTSLLTQTMYKYLLCVWKPTQEERNEAACTASGFSAFPYQGRENSERLLLREGAISRIPRSLCGNSGAKNVILVVGDGMGWEMTRAGAIAKKVVAELKTLGCDIVAGCPGNQAVLNAFAGRTLNNYYIEGKKMVVYFYCRINVRCGTPSKHFSLTFYMKR